jgi:MraZ protein
MFFGIHEIHLDDKNHLSLPANLARELGVPVYLAQGFDRNLLLLPGRTFEAIYAHLQENSLSDPAARLMNRLILGAAHLVELDEKAGFEIPASLGEASKLGGKIILVGQGEYLEIWSPELWQEQLDLLLDHEANACRFEKFNVSLVG